MKKSFWILSLAALAIVGVSFVSAASPKSSKIPTKSAKVMTVHVNSATLKQLEALPGIGPKVAADIIKHRPYKSGKDLESKVKGIGPKTWSQIKGEVSFN